MREGFVRLGGAQTYYAVAGEGPPLVLVHGLGGSSVFWQRNVGPLVRHFQVFTLDIPGFGRSEKPRFEYGLSNGIDVLRDFLDAMALENASLVGHSMGGLLCMSMALRFPLRVARLVLVDAAGLGKEVHLPVRLASVPILGELFLGKSRSFIRSEMRSLFYDPSYLTDEFIDDVYETRRSPGARHAFLATLRNGVSFLGIRDAVILQNELHQLTTPTLIVWGAQDRLFPLAHAYAAHEHIRGSTLQVFDKCGHCPHIEKADQFNELVEDFLRRS